MSYITIPKSIKQIKSNNKPLDVFLWATIRCCSNYKDGVSHARIEKLAKLTGIQYRTLQRSIQRLEQTNILSVDRYFSDEHTRHNTYNTDFRMRNYFMLDKEFFEQGYSPKIAGFILLLKSICINGTNSIGWKTPKIAEEIGMARNTVSALLQECLQHGLLTKDKCGYFINGDYFINDSVRKQDQEIFDVLDKFCKDKDSTLRPYKSKNRLALELIGARYQPLADYRLNEYIDLRYNLEKYCPAELPKEVSVEYFLKPLKLQGYYDQAMREKQNIPRVQKAFAM